MVDGKKALVKVNVVKPDEVSDEAVEAFIKAIEGKEKFYTVEELEKLLKKKINVSYRLSFYVLSRKF